MGPLGPTIPPFNCKNEENFNIIEIFNQLKSQFLFLLTYYKIYLGLVRTGKGYRSYEK
jgi:hypothetical protein